MGVVQAEEEVEDVEVVDEVVGLAVVESGTDVVIGEDVVELVVKLVVVATVKAEVVEVDIAVEVNGRLLLMLVLLLPPDPLELGPGHDVQL